jgi:hypothetical protein
VAQFDAAVQSGQVKANAAQRSWRTSTRASSATSGRWSLGFTYAPPSPGPAPGRHRVGPSPSWVGAQHNAGAGRRGEAEGGCCGGASTAGHTSPLACLPGPG